MRHIIAPSPELAQRSSQIWNVPVTYVPNGVDTSRFFASDDAPCPRESLTVLCPRRMDSKNGLVHLIRAFSIVVRTRPALDISLQLTGAAEGIEHGPYERAVREEVLRLGLEKKVAFLGNIAPSDMPPLYRGADIVCIPSLVEAVSLSALEAMATGKVVVASDVGGLPEVVHDRRTGLLVPAGDEAALSAAILELAQDAEMRRAMGEAGRVLVASEYTWAQVAERTLEIYSGVQSARRMAK